MRNSDMARTIAETRGNGQTSVTIYGVKGCNIMPQGVAEVSATHLHAARQRPGGPAGPGPAESKSSVRPWHPPSRRANACLRPVGRTR